METEVGSGIVKGFAITFLGILGLALLGGIRNAAGPTGYASFTGGQPVHLVLAGIVLIGVVTSIVYYYAHK